ncbi:hypothetical protein MJT46_011889 [Ovis ammon polii x Ovis aries]|nr:hypothetical protein MJT46_011889 [Ovis ammon polii x Ovis aries]
MSLPASLQTRFHEHGLAQVMCINTVQVAKVKSFFQFLKDSSEPEKSRAAHSPTSPSPYWAGFSFESGKQEGFLSEILSVSFWALLRPFLKHCSYANPPGLLPSKPSFTSGSESRAPPPWGTEGEQEWKSRNSFVEDGALTVKQQAGVGNSRADTSAEE